jgi:hypothetical protein
VRSRAEVAAWAVGQRLSAPPQQAAAPAGQPAEAQPSRSRMDT